MLTYNSPIQYVEFNMTSDDHRINFIARQYDWLLGHGNTHADAMSQLRESTDHEHLAILNKLETVHQGASSADPFILQQLGGLSEIVDSGDSQSNGHVPGYMAALKLTSSLEDIAAQIRTRLMAKFGYMGFLSVAGLVVSFLYMLYVYPQLDAMFSGFGIRTPSGIGSLVSWGMLGYPLFFLLLALATLITYLLVSRSTYKLGEGDDFASPLHRLPGVSHLNLALKRYLYFGIQHICARNGLSASEGVALAKSYTDYDSNQVSDPLSMAWQLETLEQEITHQRDLARDDIESSLNMAMRIVPVTMMVIVFTLFVSMIVNFYVPIFNLALIGS